MTYRNVIATSAFRRPESVLRPSLESIRAILPDWPIVVVIDGDPEQARTDTPGVEWLDTDAEVEAPKITGEPVFHVDHYNSPAWTFQKGLEWARDQGAERVLFWGSDCIAPPELGPIVETVNTEKVVWHGRVLDASGTEYCSSREPRALGWCTLTSVHHALSCGGFDLNFLRGLTAEDNDFCARLWLQVGLLWVDDRVTVRHQTHPTWERSEQARMGQKINLNYLSKKWGGLVMNGRWDDDDPLIYSSVVESMESVILRISRRGNLTV